MNARFLRSTTLESLRAEVPNNLEIYRSGDFSHIEVDTSLWFEQEIELKASLLETLNNREGDELFEVENCGILHDALSSLSPYEARDERFWVYLTHTKMLSHARSRWPIPADDETAVKFVRNHFFARDKRDLERNNVASRLWWMAYLCDRIEGLDREAALGVLLHKSDVRANLIERPTIAQSLNVFSSVVKKLHASLLGSGELFERDTFRKLMRELNSVGGFLMLDCMPSGAVQILIDDITETKISNA